MSGVAAGTHLGIHQEGKARGKDIIAVSPGAFDAKLWDTFQPGSLSRTARGLDS